MAGERFTGERPNFDGEDFALWSDRELEDDSRDELDSITAYPEGISIMWFSAAADWDHTEEDGFVVTERIGNVGEQVLVTVNGFRATRTVWDDSGTPTWNEWGTFALTDHNHNHIESLATDTWGEGVAITSYQDSLSLMPVTGGANWGPNANQAGHVVTERNGSDGKQTFHQYSNGTSYERTYTSSAWGSWSSGGGGWTAVDAAAGTKGITKLSTAPASPTDPIAVGDNDTRVANVEHTTNKNQNNGYAGLDAGGKISSSQLPSSVTGDVEYQGLWNANTNTPTLGNSGAGGVKGDLRKVSTAGTTSIDGVAEWAVGDWIIHNGTTWDKIDSTDQVSSVVGQTGVITIGQILTALLAVDGSGSGLNADQVDGIEGSDIALKTMVVEPLTFFEGGTLVTTTFAEAGGIPITTKMAGTVTELRGLLRVASSSGSVTVVVEKTSGGTTTTIATLTFTATNTTASATGLSVALAAGDFVTARISGAGTGAQNLTVVGELSKVA